MKKHALLLLLLSLTACNTPPVEDVEVVGENQVIEEQETTNQYEQTIDFLGVAEEWSVTEVVENNREYYIENAPEYWANYEDLEDYPEHMKLYLQVWKTGTFKTTDYAGQSLVLAQQSCEGPCPASFFRYAVDESTDTWTLLTAYSSEVSEMAGGPADGEDGIVEIPELEVPLTLEAYENDSLPLLNAFSSLKSDRFPESDQISNNSSLEELVGFPDTSFQSYYSVGGCIYAVSPDGVIARYTMMPDLFMSTDKEGNFDGSGILGTELTFMDNAGASEDKTFSLSAGGCGLFWSCLSTFELTGAEEALLEQVGTLDSRPVYLPTTVGERPEPSSDDSLDKRLYSAYDNYLMFIEYQAEEGTEAAESLEDYLALNSTFLLKLDNGAYTLANESKYAPMAECGKPVIYLYPEKKSLVHVEVGVDEFTVTIPDYGQNGWTVLARPSGLLTNLVDHLNYPYLFWEGNSYESVDAGETWTLSKNEIATRLPEALLGMGLNEQETADFMEFWSPKLEAVAENHVEFAFVNEDVMNQIAPLDIRPFPDQVIRFFMYYRGVNEAGNEMPTYLPATRYGFTVIEWGGSLY